nr:protein arginine N-methyltransferase [Marichromatium bheemlicum]
MLDQAIEHQRGGRAEAAEWLYRAVLALDADHAEANHNLGIIEIERGDVDAGLAHVQRALDLAPEMGGYWLTLIEGLLVAKRPTEAAEMMERARGLGLDSPEADALGVRLAEALAGAEQTPPTTTGSPPSPAPAPSPVPEVGTLAAGEPVPPSPAGTDTPLLLTLADGMRIYVPNDIDAMPTYLLLEHEDWPEPELALVRRLVEGDDLALDLGAGLGVYSLAMAHAMGQGSGQVLALEPVAESAALLALSLTENDLVGRVHVLEQALAAAPGTVEIKVREPVRPHSLEPPQTTRTVSALTLDGLLQQPAWPAAASPALVRLNLADADLPGVLDGGRAFFAAYDPLLMFRVTPAADLGALRQALGAIGYQLYRQVDALGALAPCGTEETLDGRRRNLFASTSARAERLRGRGLMV